MNTSGKKNIFSIAEINSSFTKFKFLSKHNYLFYNSPGSDTKQTYSHIFPLAHFFKSMQCSPMLALKCRVCVPFKRFCDDKKNVQLTDKPTLSQQQYSNY